MRNALLIGLLIGPIVATIPAAHAATPALSANLLAGARWQYSTDGGKTWADDPPTLGNDVDRTFHARATFPVPQLPSHATLELAGGGRYGQDVSFQFNGKDLPTPLAGMSYRGIPGIPATVLTAGVNRLDVTIRYNGRKAGAGPLALPTKLTVQSPNDLKIVTGPVLGSAGKDFFTVTCRTNMPAKVAVSAGKVVVTSGPAMFHRLRISAANRPRRYVLSVRPAAAAGPVIEKRIDRPVFPAQGLRFAVGGDSRSNPRAWKKVADAIAAARPHLVVNTGDLVRYGLNDWQWNEELFTPAGKLLRAVPFYAVLGNHDTDAPIFHQMIYNPKAKADPHWRQEINGVLLIGIDGGKRFSPGSASALWLESTLATSKARFIFLFTHYPAWTSGSHGKLDANGRPRLRAQRDARNVILPMLVKHHATAMFAGHDHFYERSELPGITHIITAAAGASQRGKAPDAARQNPHSKVFVSKLHYCLVEVAGDTAALTARTPDGKIIDRRTWTARPLSGPTQ